MVLFTQNYSDVLFPLKISKFKKTQLAAWLKMGIYFYVLIMMALISEWQCCIISSLTSPPSLILSPIDSMVLAFLSEKKAIRVSQ